MWDNPERSSDPRLCERRRCVRGWEIHSRCACHPATHRLSRSWRSCLRWKPPPCPCVGRPRIGGLRHRRRRRPRWARQPCREPSRSFVCLRSPPRAWFERVWRQFDPSNWRRRRGAPAEADLVRTFSDAPCEVPGALLGCRSAQKPPPHPPRALRASGDRGAPVAQHFDAAPDAPSGGHALFRLACAPLLAVLKDARPTRMGCLSPLTQPRTI
mmetsp:Transcript_62544/g.136749  ORF Transcript_62544/g.136749 Transcript_62544/m.136749 type:complete len:213 (-) Transcript_62544:750-1388(-)